MTHKTLTEKEYRYWYNRGWRYSETGAGGLDYGDHMGFPEAWYDGYLDLAAGRDKWHLLWCRKSGSRDCDQHDGSLAWPCPVME